MRNFNWIVRNYSLGHSLTLQLKYLRYLLAQFLRVCASDSWLQMAGALASATAQPLHNPPVAPKTSGSARPAPGGRCPLTVCAEKVSLQPPHHERGRASTGGPTDPAQPTEDGVAPTIAAYRRAVTPPQSLTTSQFPKPTPLIFHTSSKRPYLDAPSGLTNPSKSPICPSRSKARAA